VQELIERLPERQRRTLVLRYVFELGTPEIADVLGTSEDAVRHTQMRALKALSSGLGLRATRQVPQSAAGGDSATAGSTARRS
jgi:DNA-directed RNA polymerase specialized sigma24 family protein